MPNSSPDSVKFSAIPYVPLIPMDECDSMWHGSEKTPANRVCIIWEKGIHGELVIREVWAACIECVEKYAFNEDVKRVDKVRMVVES